MSTLRKGCVKKKRSLEWQEAHRCLCAVRVSESRIVDNTWQPNCWARVDVLTALVSCRVCNGYSLRQTSTNTEPFGFEALYLDRTQFSDHIAIVHDDEFTVHSKDCTWDWTYFM